MNQSSIHCTSCGGLNNLDAQFCYHCGASFTASLQVAPRALPSGTPINIVCPNCEAQNIQEIVQPIGMYDFTCPQCSAHFQSRIVTVRSKNSRGDKKNYRRTFSIRVYDAGRQESLVEFVNAGYSDFELRSKDTAVFSYHNNALKMVQNSTVGQYMKVSSPRCYVATCLYGADSEQVRLLRAWRDAYLLAHLTTARLVAAYYWISPLLVLKYGSNRLFRLGCLVLLAPIIAVVRRFINQCPRKSSEL